MAAAQDDAPAPAPAPGPAGGPAPAPAPASEEDTEAEEGGADDSEIVEKILDDIHAGLNQPSAPGPVDFPPQGAGEGPDPKGQFIPYGKHVPQREGMVYYTATGVQECEICETIIDKGFSNGSGFYDLCGVGLAKEYFSMCYAQQKVLQSCPEFMNNWCYQDLGGTQQLRAPCPSYLTCHYCLGLNPLHCKAEAATTDEEVFA